MWHPFRKWYKYSLVMCTPSLCFRNCFHALLILQALILSDTSVIPLQDVIHCLFQRAVFFLGESWLYFLTSFLCLYANYSFMGDPEPIFLPRNMKMIGDHFQSFACLGRKANPSQGTMLTHIHSFTSNGQVPPCCPVFK